MKAARSNPDVLRQKMESFAQKPLESFTPKEKSTALQSVAKDMGVKPLELLDQLEALFPSAFGNQPQGLKSLGAASEYQGGANHRLVASGAMGVRMAAMMGKGLALEGIDPQRVQDLNLQGMTSPKDIGPIAAKVFAGRDHKIATAGYSAVPDGTNYAENTQAFLGALAQNLGTGNAGFTTSPTADKGSIDAITTMLGQEHDIPVVSITAKDYVKYVDPENFPAGIDKAKFAAEPKHVFADAGQYNQATVEASNAFIATGGRDTTCFDFMRAIEAGHPVVLVDDQSMAKGLGDKAIWDGDKGRVNNGAAFLAEQLDAFKRGGAMTRDPVSKDGFTPLDNGWLAQHADKFDSLIKVVSHDGSAAGIAAAAKTAAAHLENHNGKFAHTNAASVRDHFAPEFGSIIKNDAAATADQLGAATSGVKGASKRLPAAKKFLEDAAASMTAHIKDGNFAKLGGAAQDVASVRQHTGYISGELARQFGVPRDAAREVLEPFYLSHMNGADAEARGQLGEKLSKLAGGNQDLAAFVKNDDNGWMFNQWGFGDVDRMMNVAGVYAGNAVKSMALEMCGGDKTAASQLLDDALNRSDDALAKALESPQSDADFLAQFSARAAQLTWKSAKTGVGITEAHNPKKEDRVPGKFSPGNDLITDFDSMAANKGWPEVAKDIDQIRTFLRGGADVELGATGAAAVGDRGDEKQLPKVAVYCGSFNPPHAGHRAVLEKMMDTFGLDEVYIVPDQTTAYKKMESVQDRNEMVSLLFRDDPRVKVLSPNMQKDLGDGEMWDVLRVVANEHPGAPLHNIMGTDTLEWYLTLPPSQRPAGVVPLVNRRDPEVKLPNEVDGAEVQSIVGVDGGYSSTKVRDGLKDGVKHESLDDDVFAYIRSRGLYD